jgi:protein-S-isoprenylcysteine O-methyltransferase Ste14
MWSAQSALANLVIVLIAISVFIDVHILSSKGNLAEPNYVVMTGFCALAFGLILVIIKVFISQFPLGAVVDARSIFPHLKSIKYWCCSFC